MKQRYRLIRRGERGEKFYCVDTLTGKRASLATPNRDEATLIVLAKNQALRQPALNLQIAKAYLAGSDSGVATRTWQQAMEALVATKLNANQVRWKTAIKDRAFDSIRQRVIIETQAEQLLAVLQEGTVSTNVFLRKLHNFALDMGWLPWPVMPKNRWPKVAYQPKRAVTEEEHQLILAGERDLEWRLYYELLWHLGGSQSDIATLRANAIDWQTRTLHYTRKKTGTAARIHFGGQAAAILEQLPREGLIFPKIGEWKESDRAKAFIRRCKLVGVSGVSLHSYRYAWAERARSCGYPERSAQEALGHNSKAVHRAYARNAQVTVPSLEEYEERTEKKVIPFPLNRRAAPTPLTQGGPPTDGTSSETPASTPPAPASEPQLRNAG